MNSLKILGTGMYVPELVVTNDDFSKFLDTSDEWIYTRTGMKERHISRDEPTWLLATNAARNALESANVLVDDIDMVLVSTVMPDYSTPSVACLVANQLGMEGVMALDINVACTGFAFAVDMARRYLYTGDVKKVLVISAESMSQMCDYTDRAGCVLFGDGAGAVVLEAADDIYGSFQSSEPAGAKDLYVSRERKVNPFNKDVADSPILPFELQGTSYFYMNGKEVYKFSTRVMPYSVEKACEKAGITPSQLDLIIPHQANLRIIETAIKNLDLPEDKFYVNIHKYGNTSSASIAIALHEAIQEGRLKRGQLVCFAGFGGGLTYGATLLRY